MTATPAFRWQSRAASSAPVVVELTATGWVATVAGLSRAVRSQLPEAVRAAGGQLLDETEVAAIVAGVRRSSAAAVKNG
jgi:hypothetical protein